MYMYKTNLNNNERFLKIKIKIFLKILHDVYKEQVA